MSYKQCLDSLEMFFFFSAMAFFNLDPLNVNSLECASMNTRFFFYKHKAYKYMNPSNWPKIKHILSIY